VEQLSRLLREDMHMSPATQPIKVMQVIARMNVGGPAVIVTELMRGMDSSKYQQTLVTGYCADESDCSNIPCNGFQIISLIIGKISSDQSLLVL